MHGQSPASPEGGRYLSRVGGGVVALGQTGERHPWIWLFFLMNLRRKESKMLAEQPQEGRQMAHGSPAVTIPTALPHTFVA